METSSFKLLISPLEVLHVCLQHHVFHLLGVEAVGIQRQLFCQGAVFRRQVDDGGAILCRGL